VRLPPSLLSLLPEEETHELTLFFCFVLAQELRRHLVAALPVGSTLVAVFDSCHSASLLGASFFRFGFWGFFGGGRLRTEGVFVFFWRLERVVGSGEWGAFVSSGEGTGVGAFCCVYSVFRLFALGIRREATRRFFVVAICDRWMR
jgi:hypothetical protein